MKGALLEVYRWLVLGRDESAGAGWGSYLSYLADKSSTPRLSRAWLSSLPATGKRERALFSLTSGLMSNHN